MAGESAMSTYPCKDSSPKSGNSAVQLRLLRRCGERRVTDRDREELLPYWLTRFPDHELAKKESIREAAKRVRDYADSDDPLAMEIFNQQAIAHRAAVHDCEQLHRPERLFCRWRRGRGITRFREWFLTRVREHTDLREEQLEAANFALIAELDMAGRRGPRSRPLTRSALFDRAPGSHGYLGVVVEMKLVSDAIEISTSLRVHASG